MSKGKMVSSRREMLQIGWGAVAAAGIATASETAPPSQPAGGYRALVCVYLNGGNDSNNMIVPLDDTEYHAYASARGKLALRRTSLLPIATRSGTAYGLHPALEGLRDLYSAGKMAVAANTGGAPANSDGRSHSTPDLAYLPDGFFMPDWAARWARDTGSAQSTYTFRSGATLVSPGVSQASGGQYENQSLRHAMSGARGDLRFPNTAFGREMADVASLIRIAPSWGMSRQFFTATLSGFDTHHQQLQRQHRLLRELSQTVAAFCRALDGMGMGGQVTVFTDSEFNRTLAPNADGGTGHAWGGHQLVIGGAVRGGDVYGDFPSFQSARNAWTPTLPRERFAAELIRWVAPAPPLFSLSRSAGSTGLFV